MNKRYQVFISSTYADLKEERAKVVQTIMELDCIPAGMEIFPAIDEEQFEFIKRVIDDCDYYLLIIGGRYGSLSDDGISYTEKEYDYAIHRGIKVIALLHSDPDSIPLGKSEKENSLRKKLQDFREKVSKNRLIKFWNTAEDLPGIVALSLSKTIKTYPATGWVRANTITDPDIYREADSLRKQNHNLTEIINESKQVIEQQKDALATFDDVFIFSGKHRKWDNYSKRDVNTTWTIETTWGKVFKLISPYLLEHPSDTKMKETISKQLYRLTKDATDRGFASIDDQDFQTIKIHLKTLGLIDVKYSKTTGGGMALFWNLTDAGNKLLLKLRSVKKES